MTTDSSLPAESTSKRSKLKAWATSKTSLARETRSKRWPPSQPDPSSSDAHFDATPDRPEPSRTATSLTDSRSVPYAPILGPNSLDRLPVLGDRLGGPSSLNDNLKVEEPTPNRRLSTIPSNLPTTSTPPPTTASSLTPHPLTLATLPSDSSLSTVRLIRRSGISKRHASGLSFLSSRRASEHPSIADLNEVLASNTTTHSRTATDEFAAQLEASQDEPLGLDARHTMDETSTDGDDKHPPESAMLPSRVDDDTNVLHVMMERIASGEGAMERGTHTSEIAETQSADTGSILHDQQAFNHTLTDSPLSIGIPSFPNDHVVSATHTEGPSHLSPTSSHTALTVSPASPPLASRSKPPKLSLNTFLGPPSSTNASTLR